MNQLIVSRKFPALFGWMIFVILAAVLLSGCGRVTDTTTPDPASNIPIATVLPSATNTPPPPIPTSTRTVRPSPTATHGIFERIPVQPGDSLFALTTPDASRLVDVLGMVANVDNRDGDDSFLGQVSQSEKNALYRLIAHDLQTYYPEQFSGSVDILEDTSFKLEANDPFIDEWVLTKLVEQINQERPQFTDQEKIRLIDFDLLPYAIEIDADPQNEWVILATNSRLDYTAWFFIGEQENGSYLLLPSDSFDMPVMLEAVNVETGHDLTGDGLEEVVFSAVDYAWGSYFAHIKVLTWQEERVVEILDMDRYLRVTDFSDADENSIEYQITDLNGDGREEILFNIPRSANFGCNWEEKGSYRWNGAQPVFQIQGANPPETPICWAAQGLSVSTNLTVEQKIALLERALNNLSPSSTPHNLLALIRVHLSTAYEITGNDAKSDQVRKGIQSLSLEDPFVKVVLQKYHASSAILPLCDSLFMAAQYGELQEVGETFPHLSYSATLGAYPWTGEINPLAVCPLPDLAKAMIERLPISVDSKPIDTLINMGWPVSEWAELQLDEDVAMELAVMIELSEPQIIVIDQGETYWQFSRAARLSGSADPVEFLATDLYNDGSMDLLVRAVLDDPAPATAFTSCWRPDAGRTTQFFAIHNEDNHYDAYWGSELCGNEQHSLEEMAEGGRFEFALMQGSLLAKDQNLSDINRLNFAFSLEEIEHVGEDDIWRGMEEIQEEILTGTGEIPADKKTAAMVSWISPEAPGGERIIQQLIYLTGLYYEKNSMEDRAVEVYTNLVNQWPDSIWSWLAWARLVPSSISG